MYVLLMSIIIFTLCYISNFSFSLFYNTKILSQKISKTKLKNMGLKLLSFIVGLTCLSVASYLIPNILTKLNLSVTIDITNKSIAILFGSTSVFYASQSIVKLKNILLKKEKESDKNDKNDSTL